MTQAKCITCGAQFFGPRGVAFRRLWRHRTLHQLQATAVEHVTEQVASVATARAV